EPVDVQKRERTRSGEEDAGGRSSGQRLVAQEHGRREREDRDRRRQDGRVNRGRQREPGDEEDLVERHAEQPVEEEPRAVLAPDGLAAVGAAERIEQERGGRYPAR